MPYLMVLAATLHTAAAVSAVYLVRHRYRGYTWPSVAAHLALATVLVAAAERSRK